MKIFSCKVTGFHSENLPNKVCIVDVFLGIIRPFEIQLFLTAVAKIQVFILSSVFHRDKVKNKKVEMVEIFLPVLSRIRLPELQANVFQNYLSTKVCCIAWLRSVFISK